ncbi:MAG: DEAD/DEAH box helicase [Thermodesulfobacteriota bacterium]
MTPNEIKEICIQSSQDYYEHLRKNKVGVDRIPMERIQGGSEDVQFALEKRLYQSDYISIENENRTEHFTSVEDFKIGFYDSERRILSLEVEGDIFNLQQKYFVISDLTFLVDNVKKWHQKKTPSIPFDGVNEFEPRTFNDLDKPNESQRQSINCALNNGLSYVWGPPGSGKTRVVLTNCALNYLDSSEKKLIGVFAPTNNALEVTMRALLENAKKSGFKTDKFIRLGTPSKEFAEEYPEVCEVRGLKKKLDEFNKQLKVFQKMLGDRKIIDEGRKIVDLLANLNERFGEYGKKQSKLEDLRGKKERWKLEKSKIVNSFSYKSKKILSDMYLIDEKHPERLTKLCRLLSENEQEIDKMEGLSIEDRDSVQQTAISIAKARRPGRPDVYGELDLDNIFGMNQSPQDQLSRLGKIEQKQQDVKKFIDKEETKLREIQTGIGIYHYLSNGELQEKEKKCKNQIDKLKEQTLEEKLKKDVVVFGSTLDGYIGRYISKSPPTFDHVFIDEAGYVPLVKALALCQDRPLTLIGDHKQLPPICEMDNDTLVQKEEVALLWNKSSLFVESMFLKDRDYLTGSEFSSKNEPNLDEECMEISELNTTHRFGNNLANILDKFFYKFGFHSEGNEIGNVELYLVDAGRKQCQGRANRKEVNAIVRMIKPNSVVMADEDIAVLTPYREQVTLLNTAMNENGLGIDVMTIHRSQGREWNDLIFSVVDGENPPPFFVDFKNQVARAVLNTAISRVKKNLFIVCDKQYWMQKGEQEKQLISSLIKEATEIKV